MEVVVEREKMEKALKPVMAKRGSPGGGMRASVLPVHLSENWDDIRGQLLFNTYRNSPVSRVQIPRTSGGTRPPGLPTARDRLVRQAIAKVLTPIFDPRRRYAELTAMGIGKDLAAQAAGSQHGPWRVSRSSALHHAFKTANSSALGPFSPEPG